MNKTGSRAAGKPIIAQSVKNLPAMQEIWVQFLGQEDPLEKEIAIHSIFFPGQFHGQRKLAGYVHGLTRVRHNLATKPPPPSDNLNTFQFS